MITPGIDHIALTVPDLDEQVDRLATAFGMVVEARLEGFALVADPASGLRIELGREAPHRRAFARMYTSFLKQQGGLEVQLVKYDDNTDAPA